MARLSALILQSGLPRISEGIRAKNLEEEALAES